MVLTTDFQLYLLGSTRYLLKSYRSATWVLREWRITPWRSEAFISWAAKRFCSPLNVISSAVLIGIFSSSNCIQPGPFCQLDPGFISETSQYLVPKSAMFNSESMWNHFVGSENRLISTTPFLTPVCRGLWSCLIQYKTIDESVTYRDWSNTGPKLALATWLKLAPITAPFNSALGIVLVLTNLDLAANSWT